MLTTMTRWKSIGILAIYVTFMIGAAWFFHAYVNKNLLQELVQQSGPFGIITYFLIELIYVTFTPLLNTFVLIASGYIFGGHIGFFINFFSTLAGLLLIIFLVRTYGRPLLQKVISEKFYNRFDEITQRIGPITLLIVYVLPFTPDDELTYIIAAGPIAFKRFLLPIVLGTAAKAAYSYIGDSGAQGIAIAGGMRIAMLLLGLILVGAQELRARKRNI